MDLHRGLFQTDGISVGLEHKTFRTVRIPSRQWLANETPWSKHREAQRQIPVFQKPERFVEPSDPLERPLANGYCLIEKNESRSEDFGWIQPESFIHGRYDLSDRKRLCILLSVRAQGGIT